MTLDRTLLLHVATSRRFEAAVLNRQPMGACEAFAIFALSSGLELWRVSRVQPASGATGGAAEHGFKLEDDAAVDRYHADWVARGADIILPQTTLDFSRSFVAKDRDGHPLRVYAPGEAGQRRTGLEVRPVSVPDDNAFICGRGPGQAVDGPPEGRGQGPACRATASHRLTA